MKIADFSSGSRCRRHGIRAICLLLAAVLQVNVAQAQDDEDEPEANLQAPVFEMAESNFDQWVFSQQQTAAAARKRLSVLLALRVDEIHRTCDLSASQRKKLELAGQGDMKRFFDQVEVVREKFLKVRKDQDKFNQIWQDIQPLQVAYQSGMFSVDSFLHKSLLATLDSAQVAKFKTLEHERRQFRYRAKLELAIAAIESGVPLRHAQREKLIELLLSETKPPRRPGQYEYYVVMWQLGRLPDAKLKPLLDENQFRALKQICGQWAGMEQFLRQNKLLPDDGSPDEVDE